MRHFAVLNLVVALLYPTSLLAADEKPTSTGRMVSVEIVIAQFAEGKNDVDLNLDSGDKIAARITELEKQGQISQLTRMRLSTLDQQPAQLQFGQRTPVATGRTRAGGFRRGGDGNISGLTGAGAPSIATSYTIENVGTLIGVTPHVEEDGSVSLKLELSKSQIEPAAAGEASADATDVPPSRTATLQSHSTVRLRSGQTAVVSQSQSSSKSESSRVILVTARVSDAPAPVKTPGVAADQELKVFSLQNMQAEAAVEVLTKLYKDAAVQVAADKRINSVLVRGQQEPIAEIEAILSRLDQQAK